MLKLPILLPFILSLTVSAGFNAAFAQTTTNKFNDTGDILARSAAVEDIEYQMMVQRATQTAIWAMPALSVL